MTNVERAKRALELAKMLGNQRFIETKRRELKEAVAAIKITGAT